MISHLFSLLHVLMLAQLGIITRAILDFIEVHYGFGRHQHYLSDSQVQEFSKYNYGEWIRTLFTLMFTEVSICLLLLRLAPNKTVIRPTQGLIVALVSLNVILCMLWIIQCTPTFAAWDATQRETAKCFTHGQIQHIINSQASRLQLQDSFDPFPAADQKRSSNIPHRRSHPLGLTTALCPP